MRGNAFKPIPDAGMLARAYTELGGCKQYVTLAPGASLRARATGRLPRCVLSNDPAEAEVVLIKDLPLLVTAMHESLPGTRMLLNAELVGLN